MKLVNKILYRLKNVFKGKQPFEKGVKELFFTNEKEYPSNIQIGNYTYGVPEILQWDEKTNLVIGKFCSIAGNVRIILGGNHRVDWISTYPFNSIPDHFPEAKNIVGHPASKGDINIGNDVWLGTAAVILSGVTIGDGAVIGAYSIVTKDVGPYEIFAGNPGKLIKKRFSDIDILRLLEMKWWDWDEVNIKEVTSMLCNNNINDLYQYYSLKIKGIHK